MDAALWAELAFPPHRTRLPVVGGLLMPAVREPWLRAKRGGGCSVR
ncbi:MAG: hypothetical protein HOY76_11750 [Streptomyces sp.]|nr:hypothetical protein [Streptomyces sp.]